MGKDVGVEIEPGCGFELVERPHWLAMLFGATHASESSRAVSVPEMIQEARD